MDKAATPTHPPLWKISGSATGRYYWVVVRIADGILAIEYITHCFSASPTNASRAPLGEDLGGFQCFHFIEDL